jgi:hypothetical protein
MSGSPVLIVAGVVVLLIAFTCVVGALVRREEQRGMRNAALDEPRAETARTAKARRKPIQAKPAGRQPPPAEDPLLILHLRDYTEPC